MFEIADDSPRVDEPKILRQELQFGSPNER
jgi:hypothetical protein